MSDFYAEGYELNKVYYFRYDPVIWRMLDPGTGLAICESVIDSQVFNKTFYYGEKLDFSAFSDPECTHGYYEYENSYLRGWLNDIFYNTAFSSADRKQIGTIHVEQSFPVDKNGRTLSQSEIYNETENILKVFSADDKLSIPSFSLVTDINYGFPPDSEWLGIFPERNFKPSDYTCCQGYFPEWLLMPQNVSGFYTQVVWDGGWLGDLHDDPGHLYCQGIVPIMNIVVDKPDCGDVNGDGSVDLKDVVVLGKYITGSIGASEINVGNSDVNLDGGVNLKDYVILKRHMAGCEKYRNLPFSRY